MSTTYKGEDFCALRKITNKWGGCQSTLWRKRKMAGLDLYLS